MALPDRYVIVDVETTGAHPVRDRITEVAVIRIEGGVETGRWETLVHPGIPIPAMIQDLIGITDEMVARAPAFADIADTLAGWLEGCVFVAHNARFDYGFIKNAFARVQREFEAPVLCTVKLSRALYPEHHRHGLDALIARHGFVCAARHRAMGDTEVLKQFVAMTGGAFPAEVLARAVVKAMKAPQRPAGLPEGSLDGLPDACGVYLFYATPEAEPGRTDTPLLVGQALSLRAKLTAWFAAAKGKDAELAARVRRLEWVETPGELGALLLELALLKSHRPLANRIPDGDAAFGLRLLPNRRRPPVLERVAIAGSDPRSWAGDVFGAFRNRAEADNRLRELAMLYRLCPQRLGLEAGTGPCDAHRAKRCAGVCASKERPEEHDARLLGALGSVGLKAWPWNGPVVVAERNEDNGQTAFHLLDVWCHLGTVADAAALPALAEAPRAFDLDAYRLLSRWLTAPANAARVQPLSR